MVAAPGAALARAPLSGRHRWVALLGAGVAAVLAARAVAVEVLLLADRDGEDGDGDAQRWWTLVVWNPRFLLGGITFGMAALAARRSAP